MNITISRVSVARDADLDSMFIVRNGSGEQFGIIKEAACRGWSRWSTGDGDTIHARWQFYVPPDREPKFSAWTLWDLCEKMEELLRADLERMRKRWAAFVRVPGGYQLVLRAFEGPDAKTRARAAAGPGGYIEPMELTAEEKAESNFPMSYQEFNP